MAARNSAALSMRSAGISCSVNLASLPSPSQTMAFIVSRSTTPLKFASAPIGSCSGTARAPSFSLMSARHMKKSAPVLSILLEKMMRGTPYLSPWRQTVSVCGSTPWLLSSTHTAPSSTRSERSTSMVKSTWPGRVDDVEALARRQKQVVAADVMVMPRSASCSMKSMVAAPSCTSPILWLLPV